MERVRQCACLAAMCRCLLPPPCLACCAQRHPAQRSATSILAHAATVHENYAHVRLLLVHLKAVGHARPCSAQAAPAGRWIASITGGPSPACSNAEPAQSVPNQCRARSVRSYPRQLPLPALPTCPVDPSFECRYRFSTGLLAGVRAGGAAAGQGWGPGRCASETQTSCAAMGAMPPQAQQHARQEATR